MSRPPPLAARAFAALAVLFIALLHPPAAAQGIGQWMSPGPLARDHAEYEGVTQCTLCHAVLQGVTTDRCVACHDSVEKQIRTKTGFHSDKADRCGTCHPDHKGRDFELARVELSPADHFRETGFLLDGAHERTPCLDCHEAGNWGKVDPACDSCHRDPHGAVDHIEMQPCDRCHLTSNWTVRSIAADVFDHTDRRQTDYVLKGAHKDVDCLDCHFEAKFAPVKFDGCTSCHRDPHASRFDPGCVSCHDEETWVVPDFDHAVTGWALDGQHGQVRCEQCHKGGFFTVPKRDTCERCHKDVHKGQFAPRACDECHTVVEADFRIPGYDHAQTQFPLVGKHVEVACGDCHGEGPGATWRPVEHQDCDACHDDIHEGQFEPTDCRTCHVETGWAVSDFDHDRTDFPLRGEHVDVDCEGCHGAGASIDDIGHATGETKWTGIPHGSCLDCHDDDQPHKTQFTMERCDGCHDEVGFDQITFAHAEETEFDLEPQHVTVACKGCHEALDAFDQVETTCRPCHEDDTPAGHYEGACEDCHRADAWRPADLGGRSHDITGFTLVGTHSLLACKECHGPAHETLAASGTECIDCHAEDDAHRNLIGAPCDDCHTPTTWLRTRFRHGTTGWPLRGAHRLATCDDCHALTYAGTPNDCWRCHEAEAPRDEPAHQSAFFPQCDLCHRPYTWNALPDAFVGAPERR
ncbi:MAG: cytochrome c3 family protein [Myxococcota bacterium]